MNKTKTACILLIIILVLAVITCGICVFAHKDCIKAHFTKENDIPVTEDAE